MKNQTIHSALEGLQKKFDALKTQISLVKSLSDNITLQFESLKYDFEAIKRTIESINKNIEFTNINVESSQYDSEATRNNIEATSINSESTSFNVESTDRLGESKSINAESSRDNSEFTKSNSESSSSNVGKTTVTALSAERKKILVNLIIQNAKEKLKLHFGFPNIPDRMAVIFAALKEKKKLTVAEMIKITGASNKSLARDMRIFRQLGWTKFNGSRRNGYFTLTEEGEKAAG
jgi:hypothetical protein